ncbi:MAG: hypothetical protein KAX19_05455, partial [Candidatus Brocadiae bacterium]|nr:hypothetical protein [Candidatus Brocadiia bacterium]
DAPQGGTSADAMPLGEQTRAAYEAFHAVEAQVDGFFARCRTVRFNPAAAAQVGIGADEAASGDLSDARSMDAALAREPLAEPNAEGVLPLDGSANPVYRDALRALRMLVVEPIVGSDAARLSQPHWDRIGAVLAPHGEWLAARPEGNVEKLGREKLQRYLDGPYTDVVRVILARDHEVADRLAEAEQLTKLLLYHKHLLQLANNFVSFPDLYDPDRRAMFEMGSLVIDGRWFELSVKVEHLQEHSKLAKTSGMYVLYAELTRVDETDRTIVAVPATGGTAGNLCVGKRGVFYDTEGRHYDARIVQIIENPISFREPLVAPFVKLGRFIGGKIEAISGSAQKALEGQVGRATQKVQAGVQGAVRSGPTVAGAMPAAATSSQVSASRRDMLLGASVSIAALTSAFAFITKSLAGVKGLTILLALVVVVLVVLLPTALVAAFKLRRRDLSAILEGCGWAINARMRLNRRQRAQFTHEEPYPKEASGTPPSRWYARVLMVVLLALIAFGVLKAWGEWGRPWWQDLQRPKPEPAPAVQTPAAQPSGEQQAEQQAVRPQRPSPPGTGATDT